MSEPEKAVPADATPVHRPESRGSRHGFPWSYAIVALLLALLVWDFSDIIFARLHREAAVDLLKPQMRLTSAERELNKACYSTLYVSPTGLPPMLEVTTCRHVPWTLQVLRRALPKWDMPEQAISKLLSRTQFTVYGTTSGTIDRISDGHPQILELSANSSF